MCGVLVAKVVSGRVPVEPLDVFAIRYVSDVQVAARGERVAFVRTDADRHTDGYSSAVWVVDRTLAKTTVVAEGRLPRLSPRGELVALARGHHLWVVGADRRSVVALPGPIREVRWQPEAELLAVVADLPMPDRDSPSRQGLHHIRRAKVAVDGEGFTRWRRPQVLLVNPDKGDITPLTQEPFGAFGVTWSPAGDRLAYIRSLDDPDIGWSRELCVMPVAGGRTVAWGRGVGIQNLEWCPTGERVAFRAAQDEYRPSMNFDLWSIGPGRSAELLTRSLDRFVGNDRTLCDSYWAFQTVVQGARWDPDGHSLVLIAADRGRNRLFRVRAAGGDLEPVEVPEEAVVFDFDVAATTGEVVATVATEAGPSEVWCLSGSSSVTDINKVYTEGREVARPKQVVWQSSGRDPLEGWIYSPTSPGVTEPPPLVLLIHGGPYRQHSVAFNLEVQVLVGHGYAVFCPNPRGSQGYGEAVASAIDNDWGHHDYEDLMAGVDMVISGGYGDPRRLLVLGGSYGGYMVNWIVTHSTRFRAAVSDRSISDLPSYLGTADGALTFGRYLFGSPWDQANGVQLRQQSPLTHVAGARTPTLLLHGLEDQVCPMDQSRQFYLALRESGCEVELLLFPGESHDLPRSGRPSHRVRRMDWILDWFDRHLQEETGTGATARPESRRQGS